MEYEIGQVINWNDRNWKVVEIEPTKMFPGRIIITARLIQKDGMLNMKHIGFFADAPKFPTYFSKGKKGWS
jgi:Pyruvate/2-oxoacid:ferredoxin oxidoreductase gamma subunit